MNEAAGGKGSASGARPAATSVVPAQGRSAPAPLGDPARFARLTRRHRECLRGVRELKGSKEIAEELGIEKSTVDSYLTEAVKVLGARNRRDAALQLAAHDADLRLASSAPMPPPDKIGPDSARLSGPVGLLPPTGSPDEPIVGQPETRNASPPMRSWGMRLPFRRKGQAGNDLSVGDRLIWIQFITLGIAVGFGMLMSGLQVLTGLIESMTRHLS